MRTAVSRLLAASAALALVVPSLAAPEAQHPHFAVEPQLQQQQRPLVADPSARPPPHYVQLDQGKDTYAGASVLRVRVDGGARLAELMELAAVRRPSSPALPDLPAGSPHLAASIVTIHG